MNGAFLLGMTAQRKLDLSAMWELIDYKNIFLLKANNRNSRHSINTLKSLGWGLMQLTESMNGNLALPLFQPPCLSFYSDGQLILITEI